MRDDTTCVANIGPAQRRWRLIAGIGMTAAAVGLFALMLTTGAPRLARLALFAPVFAAAVLLLQVRERTCIALAARGQQQLESRITPVTDPAALQAQRIQAARVRHHALMVSIAITALSLVP